MKLTTYFLSFISILSSILLLVVYVIQADQLLYALIPLEIYIAGPCALLASSIAIGNYRKFKNELYIAMLILTNVAIFLLVVFIIVLELSLHYGRFPMMG